MSEQSWIEARVEENFLLTTVEQAINWRAGSLGNVQWSPAQLT